MTPDDELAELRAENAELRARVETAETMIADLRAEAIARRAEVRALAEALPAAMSRHALVWGMVREVRHHPDKVGGTKRGLRKLGRAPRKALRMLLRKA